MDYETVLKVLTGAATFVGGVISLWRIWNDGRYAGRQHSKAEVELLTLQVEKASGDPVYQKFLEDVRKERLFALCFGWSIPNGQLGAVMRLYARGVATITEIRSAWPYHLVRDGDLSFELSRKARIWRGIVLAYAVLLLVLTLCMLAPFMVLLTSDRWKQQLDLGVYFLLAGAVTVFWIRTNEDVLTAWKLNQRLGGRQEPLLGPIRQFFQSSAQFIVIRVRNVSRAIRRGAHHRERTTLQGQISDVDAV